MKKSYIKLLTLELIIFVILIINSFAFNFLTGYKMIFFLLVVLAIFKWQLGFEKDRHRFIKDFILDELIFLIVFLLGYYFVGLFIGFYKTDFFNFNSLRRLIFPNILYICLREYIRYLAMAKSEGNKSLTLLTVLLLIFLDISTNIYLTIFSSKYGIFIFISTIVLPVIFRNITFSYMTRKVGYKPILFYCLFMELYTFVIPIAPNANEYISTIIAITLPAILCYRTNLFFEQMDNKVIDSKEKKKKPYLLITAGTVLVSIMVYFTSGYFDQWAVVVASNSMSKKISKGDIVIINKIKNNYESIEEGDILAYNYNNKMIIHRVVEAYDLNGKYYFKTKGDANLNVDEVLIEEDMVVGVVTFKIPYMGLPTIWLKNL